MIEIRSSDELVKIKTAGRIVNEVLRVLSKNTIIGISTYDLDKIAEEIIKDMGGIPAFKGYMGYPATICSSVNDSIVHEIPSKKVKLKDGDIIGYDVGAEIDGYFADAALTVAVGKVSDQIKCLMEVTKESLAKGIEQAVEGNKVSDISHAIGSFVEANGFSVVRRFVGHGIGRKLHEAPEIPNFGKPGQGPRLAAGMVLAIEPMVNQEDYEIYFLDDGWTAKTQDGLYSAHYEHTVIVGKEKAEIVT